jgi:hypothetical protein
MKAQKEKLRVIIMTSHHKIKGEVHLYENSRLTDILNADTATKDFLPVTEAQVTELASGHLTEVSFLSVNRQLVEMVMEDDELVALTKARELITKRRFADALPFAQRAVKASRSSPEGYFVLGFCQAKTGDTRSAKESFEHCLSLSPAPETRHQVEEMLKAL